MRHQVDLAQFIVARWRSKGEDDCTAATLLLMTQAQGSMPARRKSDLQIGGFEHRRRFGQGHKQHLGLFGVLQLHHRRGVVHALAAHLAGNLAVIGAGRIQQQQGVAGRRGIHHDEFLARFADDARESLEDGDFLGAGRAQIFFQQRAALGVELRAFGLQNMLPVALGFGVRVDAADGQLFESCRPAFPPNARPGRRW